MNLIHQILIFAVMISISFTADAEEVYESVDKEGVVEFSDKPSSDAQEIDVKPNVVDVAPVESVEPSSPASSTGAAKTAADSVQSEAILEREADEYYDDYEKRREIHREQQEEQVEHREEVVRQPAHRSGHRR